MSDAVYSLRVSYGLISQEIVDLPLPPRRASDSGVDKALLLLCLPNGALTIQSQEEHHVGEVRGSRSSIIIAKLFRDPARLQTEVEKVFVEAPPDILDRNNNHNQFPLDLHCSVLLTAGIVLDFTKSSVKIAISRGTAFKPSAAAVTSLSVLPLAPKMDGNSDMAEQHDASKADEHAEESTTKGEIVPPIPGAPTVAPMIEAPPAPTGETLAPTSQHLDSETESEEDLDEPNKPAVGLAPLPLSVLPATSTNGDTEETPPPKQEELSQDGISSFLSTNKTPQKTYANSRKRKSVPFRDSSTASTIPESVKSDGAHVSTSFVTLETAARSVKKSSATRDSGTDMVTPAEDAGESTTGVGVGVEDEALQSASDDTSTLNLRKRDLEAEDESSEDGADSRLLKAARYEQSSLDEIVVAKPSISKLKTPSRPSAQPLSTQQRRGTQRSSKTPATPAPKLSSTPSSGKPPKRILLSSSKLSNPERNWLQKQANVVEEVPGRMSNFVCVVRDKDLPATVKVLRSLIANKLVVSDQWVTDSKETSELLDPSDYIHTDLQGSDIKPNDRRYIWKGKTLFFTTSAANSYGDDWEGVRHIANDSGAAAVEHGNANKGGELLHDKANTILFGTDITKDRDAQALLSEYGRTVYDRKMFSTAIIKADFDLESDEFQLVLPNEGSAKARKGRGR